MIFEHGIIRLTLFLFTFFVIPISALATEDPEQFSIPNSAVHTIPSGGLERGYRVFVRTPNGYDDKKNDNRRYPVVYLNDGPYTFQVASGTTHLAINSGKIEKVILVGISFAIGEGGMMSRVRDLTPSEDPSWENFETGGAPEYLEFLKTELIPFVEKKYRANPEERVLAGQSLGGSFGAWVLLREPELFSHYILTSPSLWFHDREIFELEARVNSGRNNLEAMVYFSTGEQETPGKSTRHDMVGDQQAFVARLEARGYPGLDIKSEIIPGAIHETTFPQGFLRAMQWMFATELQ